MGGAVIRTNMDVALGDPDSSPEDLRRAAEVVAGSAARMSTLVDDLVVYARHGTRPERNEPVDLRRLAAELAGEFSAPAEARRLRVVDAAGAGPPLPVLGDGEALRRAVANLLANAVRLAPEGSAVTVAAGAEGGSAWISVADEGPGIAPSDQPLVFQRFWQRRPEPGPGSAGPGGPARPDPERSGLGLTIVRQIAESHGGSVELASAPGEGSTFVIRLPAASPS